MRLSTSVCKSQFFYIYLMWHWPAVKVKAICTAHSCKHAHASNALSSLTRAACRTTTMYSLQTQAGAAAGQATPVSRTKVPTFRNRYKWVTTHFTVPWRVEGWVDLDVTFFTSWSSGVRQVWPKAVVFSVSNNVHNSFLYTLSPMPSFVFLSCQPTPSNCIVLKQLLILRAWLTAVYFQTKQFNKLKKQPTNKNTEEPTLVQYLKACAERRNWTELNWHGLVFDELTNEGAGRARWSLVGAHMCVVT